ncbi:fatty acid hydroxylase superfamily protein [Hypoxylon sp. NC1633]|nr:fatty acid hydroxylase superfamily protein [Hypoxylon sp. NC1633]
MDGTFLSNWVETLLQQYPSGYVEVLASVSVQVIYIIFGLILEVARPSYDSETSPKMLVQSLWNHFGATMLHVIYVACRGGKSVLTRTFAERPYQLPRWEEMVGHVAVALIMRDVVFYLIHRLWHTPLFYAVHAKHHEVKQPGNHHILTISYMSMVDFLFLYGAPVMLVAKILEMNIITTMAFAFISAAGEQVNLIQGDNTHEEHHISGKGSYGVYGIMDSIFSHSIFSESVSAPTKS